MSGFDILGPADGLPLRPQGPQDPARILRGPGEGAGSAGAPERADGFAARLVDALEQVDALRDESATKADALAKGEPVELHDLLASMEKSDVAFQLMVEVRNRLLDAWQTLQRTSV